MQNISTSFTEFSKALERGEAVVGTKEGSWYVEGYLGRFWRWITSGESRVSTVSKAIFAAMDEYEKSEKPLEHSWEVLKVDDNTKTAIAWRMYAARLRGGLEKTVGSSQTALENLAKEWKTGQTQLTRSEWNSSDTFSIDLLCNSHPTLANLLVENKKLRERFFVWAIRDECDVSTFVKYPALFDLFERCALSASFWVAGASNVNDGKVPVVTKDGVKHVSPWSAKKLTFPGGLECTISQVFKEFRERNKFWPNFLWTAKGIENWSATEWGYQNKSGEIERKIPQEGTWIKDLLMMKTYSLEEAKEMYPGLDGTNYGFALRATQKTPNLDINRTHGFLEFAIPNDDGTYQIMPLGKFTKELPQSMLELFGLLGDTVPGVIASHDSNAYYRWRSHAWEARTMDKEIFDKIAEKVRQSILASFDGEITFSIFADSCSHWALEMFNEAQKALGEKPVDYFTIPLVDAEPSDPVMKSVIGFMNLWPEPIKPIMTRLMVMLFAPSRGVLVDGVKRRVLGSRAWTDLTFMNPSWLFRLQRERLL